MVHATQNYSQNRPISDKFIIINPTAPRKVHKSEISSQSLSNLNKKNEFAPRQLKKTVLAGSNISKYYSSQMPEFLEQSGFYTVIRDSIISGKQVRFKKSKISEWGKILGFSSISNKECNVTPEELKITVDRIHGLTDEDEEDEYGEVVNPTEYAIQKAIELVSEAANSIPDEFFKAWVSSEDTGGIRLTWSKPEFKKQLRLIVPPTADQQIYLYHEQNDEYGVEYNISA